MSHIVNTIQDEFRMERNKGAYEITIPHDTIYTDTYLKRQAEQKEREELEKWDETEGDNDIY